MTKDGEDDGAPMGALIAVIIVGIIAIIGIVLGCWLREHPDHEAEGDGEAENHVDDPKGETGDDGENGVELAEVEVEE